MGKRRINRGYLRKKELQADCEGRAEAWQSLTPEQQLAALDRRLGEGVGAKKQRAKLQAKLGSTENKKAPKQKKKKKSKKNKKTI